MGREEPGERERKRIEIYYSVAGSRGGKTLKSIMDAPFSLDLDISRSDASCQDIRASRLGTAFDSLTAASVALASEKKRKKRLVRIARLKKKKKKNAQRTIRTRLNCSLKLLDQQS